MTISKDAIDNVLAIAAGEGRSTLFEHEVYGLLGHMGVDPIPTTVFVKNGEQLPAGAIDSLSGDKVVIKVVSPDITHKSDVGGVRFVERTEAAVNASLKDMFASKQLSQAGNVVGAIVCQFLKYDAEVFGAELFVGLRSTREFGPVLAAGLGGINTEYYAANMAKGRAVTTAIALDTTADEFMARFKQTSAYELIAGIARGHKRLVSDEQLHACFASFIEFASTYCVSERGDKPTVSEFEINPFALCDSKLTPLDGFCKLGEVPSPSVRVPIAKIDKLLHPSSIAVVGASAKGMNPGRVILKNVVEAGFEVSNVFAIKEGLSELDGVQCVDTVGDLPRKVDLIVLAVAASQVCSIAEDIIARDAAEAVILIPGGLGETEGGKEAEASLRRSIAESHGTPGGGPVFLGGNCLGLFSRPGGYDTLFIPKTKLPKNWDRKGRRVALISQSGAFMITQMSSLEFLNPNYAVSCGNQVDLTVADIVEFMFDTDAADVFAVYVEGFSDLGGLALAKHVRKIVAAGKEVVFYKAGRTAAGRTATAGHTASIAGDYSVCEAALEIAGAMVAGTFMEFRYCLELATFLYGREVRGTRIACSSNAGFETVGMADSISGPGFEISIESFDDATASKVAGILSENRLEGLVNVRIPLDLTPMATDQAHEECIRAMVDQDSVDAIVASFVPLTPAMKTTPEEVDHVNSMTKRMPKIFADTDKPVVVVIDSGTLYDSLAAGIRESGIPVFRTADSAVRTLAKYLCHKLR